MRHPKSAVTGKAGVIYVSGLVNEQGSIFRPVHQEDDVGIDGFIEFAAGENVLGHLIAVQIKSGESFVNSAQDAFQIPVDDRHLTYWRQYPIPVILVGYSPARKLAAWESVRDYVERETYMGRMPVRHIDIPFSRKLTSESLSGPVHSLARLRSDERSLVRCADMCLSRDLAEQRQGFEVLSNHPDSRGLRLTCLLARRFLLSEDTELAKDALYALGYGVGRFRWSWNPNNKAERDVAAFASGMASTLNRQELLRMIELVDDEHFHGPEGLGERCFDVFCCNEEAWRLLDEVLYDPDQPIGRRATCLYMQWECDASWLEEETESLREDPRIAPVVDYLLSPGGD